MKKISFLLSFVYSLIITFATAQDILTYNNTVNKKTVTGESSTSIEFEFSAFSHDLELENISSEIAGEHMFGTNIAKKINLFESKYTREVALVPGNPQTKTIIYKPVIYESVKKIEKYLKKAVKKNEITIETASANLNKVLDVAINIATADTKAFEERISETGDTNNLLQLYVRKVKLVY